MLRPISIKKLAPIIVVLSLWSLPIYGQFYLGDIVDVGFSLPSGVSCAKTSQTTWSFCVTTSGGGQTFSHGYMCCDGKSGTAFFRCTSLGTSTLKVTFGSDIATRTITVKDPNLKPPVINVATQILCKKTVLIRNNEPPSGYEYFWQFSPNSESTLLGSDNVLELKPPIVTQTVYLRARSVSAPYIWGDFSNVGTFKVYEEYLPTPTITKNPIGFFNNEYTLSVSGPPQTLSYEWYRGAYAQANKLNESASSYKHLYTKPESFYVVAKAGCPSAVPLKIDITLLPLPQILVDNGGSPDLQKGPLTLTANNTYGSYSWRLNGTLVGQNRTVSISSPGKVSLQVSHVDAGTKSAPDMVLGSQSPTNYVISNTIKTKGITSESMINPLTKEQKLQVVKHFDGLGRDTQTIQTAGSPLGNDLISPVVYDEFGRADKQYLPFVIPGESNGWEKSDPVGVQRAAYASSPQAKFYQTAAKVAQDAKPYSQTYFDGSQLNRPTKVYGTGANWAASTPENPQGADRNIAYQYTFNQYGTGVGQEKVLAWKIGADGMPLLEPAQTGAIENGGHYSSNTLSVTVAIDESRHTVREYKDKQGKVILKKIQVVENPTNLDDPDQWACTYYVYDDFGRLSFVLSPEGVKAFLATQY